MRVAGGIALAVLLALAGLALIWARGAGPTVVPFAVVDPGAIEVEEAEFESDGHRLVGRLFLPTVAVTATAVVLSNAGETGRRDGRISQLVAALTGAGVAVLLPDKRGTGGSEGDWRTSSYEALARDAGQAMAWMRTRHPDLPMTLIGVGEGGGIAPLAVQAGAAPDRVLALSGGVETAFEALENDARERLRDRGLPPAMAERLAPLVAWHRREVREAVLWAAIGDFDPARFWEALDVPGLILLGGADTARAHLAGKVEVRRFPALDRDLRAPGTDRLDPEVMALILRFATEGSP